MFSKGTQPFDFVKGSIIRKLAYKVKYIDQFNGAFRKFKSKIFLKISWLDCEEYWHKAQ